MSQSKEEKTSSQGETYYNVFGLMHRVPSPEEIAQLDPTQKFLEHTLQQIMQDIEQDPKKSK